MSRRLEKLIEQKAWETLTDYGYNDAHLLEQLTESVLDRFANLDEGGHVGAGKQVMNPMSGTPDVLGFSRGGMTKQPKAPTSGVGSIPGYLNPPVRGGEGFMRGGVRYWRGPDGQVYRWFGEPGEGGRGWVPVSGPETPFGG